MQARCVLCKAHPLASAQAQFQCDSSVARLPTQARVCSQESCSSGGMRNPPSAAAACHALCAFHGSLVAPSASRMHAAHLLERPTPVQGTRCWRGGTGGHAPMRRCRSGAALEPLPGSALLCESTLLCGRTIGLLQNARNSRPRLCWRSQGPGCCKPLDLA